MSFLKNNFLRASYFVFLVFVVLFGGATKATTNPDFQLLAPRSNKLSLQLKHLSLPVTTDNPNLVGTLSGSFDVDSLGQANYSIPLKAIPGTAGITPALSINYNSSTQNGVLGVGFSLSGLTAIVRSPQTYAQNGQVHGINFDNNDRFSLSGQQLVPINGKANGADGAEYRTYIDSQSRIISHGQVGQGPASFTVQTKGGQTAYYGMTSDSAIASNGRDAGTVQTWALDEIEDAAGNYELIHYIKDPDQTSANAAFYPSEIDYTGNDSAKLAPYLKVKFVYEQRPASDFITRYTRGSLTKITQRLKEVQVYNDLTTTPTLVYDYHFNYEISPNTGRSRLISLQECGVDGECFAPTQFSWQNNPEGWTAAPNFNPPVALVNSDHTKYMGNRLVWNLIGNGLPSIVTQDAVYFDNGSAWVKAGSAFNPPAKLDTGFGDDGVRFVDLSGNGLPDTLWSTQNFREENYSAGAWLNTGAGWQEDDAFVTVDGEKDLQVFPYFSMQWGDGTQRSRLSEDYWVTHPPTRLIDLNGNGLLDVLASPENMSETDAPLPEGWKGVTNAYLNSGSTWSLKNNSCVPDPDEVSKDYPPICSGYSFPLDMNPHNGVRLVDLTGNGLLDVIAYTALTPPPDSDPSGHAQPQKAVWMNTGSGFQSDDDVSYVPTFDFRYSRSFAACDKFVSVYADGLSDLAMTTNPDWHSSTSFLINTGNGWIGAPDAYAMPVGMCASPDHGDIWDNGVRFFDINGGGKAALVESTQVGSNQTAVWLNENGWVKDAAYTIPSGLYFTDGNGRDTGLRIADLLGTGMPDLLFSDGKTTQAYLNKAQTKPDMLRAITNGFGATTNISYQSIMDHSGQHGSAVYTMPDATRLPAFPNVSLFAPYYVVSQTSESNESNDPAYATLNGGLHVTDYRYAGALYNKQGGGFLGFSSVTKIDESTGLHVVTAYSQDYAGHTAHMPIATNTYTKAGVLIHATSKHYTVKKYGGTAVNTQYFLPYTDTFTKNSYDLSTGKLIDTSTTTTQIDDYGNPTSIVTKITDALGNVWSAITTNHYQNIIDSTHWFLGELLNASVTSTAPNTVNITRSTSYTYSPITGMLLSSTVAPTLPTLSYTKTLARDAFGNVVTTTTTAEGVPARSNKVSYDAQGRFVVSTTNALNQTVKQATDTNFGVVLSSTDLNGLTTTYHYNGLGQLTETDYPDHSSSKMTYAWEPPAPASYPAALKTQRYYIVNTHPDGTQSAQIYDALGRVIEIFKQGFDGTKIIQDTQYNDVGKVSQQTLPYFKGASKIYNTTFKYDVLGRDVLSTKPDGGTIKMAYDGLATTITNPLGQSSTKLTNPRGKLIESIDALGNKTTYQYDAFGNMTTMTDSAGNITNIAYDAWGHKLSINDPDRGVWSYTYDPLGELLSQTDNKKQTTKYTYNLLGQLDTRTDPAGTSTWIYGNDVTKHNVGQLVTVTGVANQADLIHAAQNNLVSYTRNYAYDDYARPAAVTTDINGQSYVTSTTYDSISRPSVVTYPGNVAVKNNYNAYGYLSSVSNNTSGTVYWTANHMDAAGHIISETRGANVLNTAYNYDPTTQFLTNITTSNNVASLGHLAKLQFNTAASSAVLGEKTQSAVDFPSSPLRGEGRSEGELNSNIVQSLAYTYDTLGNVKTRNNGATGDNDTFTYDGLDRLTGDTTVNAGKTTQALSYSYDALGNILNKSNLGTYTYAGHNITKDGAGPHAVTSVSSSGATWSYRYDLDGNQTEELSGSKLIRQIAYTSFDKPKTISLADGDSVNFYYNADRSRFERVDQVGKNTSTTLYLGNVNIVTHTNGSSVLTNMRYYVAPGVMLMNDDKGNSATYYLIKDALGSTTAITNSQGTVIQRFRYTPFGEQVQTAGTKYAYPITHHGFTGQEEVEAAGLIHMNGRLYDPELGRFLSADPFIQAPDNSQSLNRYSYCMNNPLAFTDPTGYFSWHNLLKFLGFLVAPAYHVIGLIQKNKYLGTLMDIAVGAMCTIVGGPAGVAMFGAFMAESTYGATGNIHAAIRAGLMSAASMAAFNFLGSELPTSMPFGIRAMMHGALSGSMDLAEGGSYMDGFLAATVSGIADPGINSIGVAGFASDSTFTQAEIVASRGALSGLVGGTVAAVSGASFANGALTSAYADMFNDNENRGVWGRVWGNVKSFFQNWGDQIRTSDVEENLEIGFSAIPEAGAVEEGVIKVGKDVAEDSKILNWSKDFLGENPRVITNRAGDKIFTDINNSRRIRFDINNSHGDEPHMHIEIKDNSGWRDYTSQHRIYFRKGGG